METNALILACFTFLFCELIPTMLYVFMVLTDFRLRVKVMASGLYTLIEIIKYSCTLLYKNEVRNCLKFVEEDWRNVINPSDRISMIDRVRTSKRLIMMCAIFMYFSGMGFRIIIPLSTGKIITSENITIRPLPHVAYLVILDVQSSPVYEIVYFIQFLSGLIKYTITVTTFGFMTLCAMHFCAQSDILVTLMNDFVNENQPENLNKRLAIVVERQIRIRKLKVMASGIFTIIEIIKYSYAVLYKSQVKNCLILVDEDWRNVTNPSDRISMIDRVRTSKRLIVICAIIVYVTGMAVRMIIPLSVGKIVTSQNITIRPLPHVAYLVIFDVQRSPVYEIVYFIQFLAGLIKYTITVTTFGFMTLCAMHFCAQSDILVTLMNNFVNENQRENLNTRLATVVEHQIRIRNDIIPGVLYWLMAETARVRLQTIPLLLYDFMSVSQYGIFIFRYDKLRRCLQHIEEDWKNVLSVDARNIMLKSARTGKRLVTICAIFMYSGAFTFRTILPLFQGKIVIDQNITIRHLACPGYFFSLDVQVSPVYETVFVIQCLTGFIAVSIVTCACGLTAIFVVHACGQLKILIGLMRELVQKQWQEEREMDMKLAEIVEHQTRVRKEMSQNKHHQNDILYITQPTRNILLALGAWPSINKGESVHSKVHNLLLIFMSYTLLFCDLIPGILYWLMKASTRVRLQMIPLLLYDFMSASQYGIFISRYDQLKRCLKYVEEDWENTLSVDARNIMLKSARTGKRLVTICAFFMYSGVITFRGILPLFQGKIVIDQNVTIRRFACPGYYFSLDVQVSPIYETVFIIQFLTGFITVSIVTCACGLTAIFVVHACGQLKILIGLMTGLVQKEWQEECETNKKLAEIVEHQIRVRKLYFTNTQWITLFIASRDWQTRNIGTLCSYLISIINVIIHMFLFCYTGEQLTGQAEKVAITSCVLEWYRLPDKKARSVILLIIMSNMPTKISAGQFIDLSLKTFGNVMKTAGTYFNMLRSVID
ncbi:PREDICTED: uncharacterized protein LOC108761985 [Trachymyrmex cornetzi]|uniref:uncharacterized protein LOC108761985 n=1 Tax=Trachymyrmex cornetzi TaxID=471704 RepID=UPI00084F7599|nr:PREDICTED: uncharacterized protein LOC108761985 [Trachymyrmex cornetzi]